MINYNKLMEKLKEKGITTYTIRQKALIPQGTLAKLKMCSGATMEEIEQKLQEYKDTHNGKDFMCDVSTKTIEKTLTTEKILCVMCQQRLLRIYASCYSVSRKI